MTREATESEISRAALFAAGALPDGKAVLDSEVASFEPAVLSLSANFPTIEPPAFLKQRILDRLPPPGPAMIFRHRDDQAFQPSRLRGVTYRMLHEDRIKRKFTALVRMAPGTVLRSHVHAEDLEPEECLVLEGELIVGDVLMRAGEYQRAAPGSVHLEQRTETGALLYFSGSLDFLAS